MAHLAPTRPKFEGAWRYVDAYIPRLFGLYLHTALIAKYGSAEYSVVAWLLGILAILFAAIPDPHSLLLVRSHGVPAQRLLGLSAPWLLLKVVLASALTWATLYGVATGLLMEQSSDHAAIAATLWLGSAEFLWAVLGTCSLAIGNVRTTAIAGVISRFAAVVVLTAGWLFDSLSLGESLAVAAAPTTVALVIRMPPIRLRRSSTFMLFSLRTYAIWAQGISLVTIALFQLPMVVLGTTALATPAGVGQISYLSRILQAILQPLQILQSIVIRDSARARSGMTVDFRWMRIAFRTGAGTLLVGGLAVLYLLDRREAIEPSTAGVGLGFTLGVAFSGWFRFELSQRLASANIRLLLMRAYLPILLATVLMIFALVPFFGAWGLAVGVALGWVALSLCWNWT